MNKLVMEIPEAVKAGLNKFCEQIKAALIDELISIIHYGGLMKGEYTQMNSDVNVMLVLKNVSTETLDKVASPFRQGQRDFRLSLLLLSDHDLRRSTDVFPIKFLDMQRHHQVLWGDDLLEELEIKQEHLRLRCEQELRNLVLRLHQFYLQRIQYSEQIEGTLTQMISPLLNNLGVLLKLKTHQWIVGKETIAEEATRELNLADNILQQLLDLKEGSYKPSPEELKQLYNELMNIVEKAAEFADQL